jgi:hypothetical protein
MWGAIDAPLPCIDAFPWKHESMQRGVCRLTISLDGQNMELVFPADEACFSRGGPDGARAGLSASHANREEDSFWGKSGDFASSSSPIPNSSCSGIASERSLVGLLVGLFGILLAGDL